MSWQNRQARWLILVFQIGLLAAAALASARPDSQENASSMLSEASQCSEEPRRLQRLFCFDEVFGTPPPDPRSDQAVPDRSVERAENWRLAYAQESRREPGEGFRYRDTGSRGGHILTLAALGIEPPRPLLMVQCHKQITELAVMLPQPVTGNQTSVSVDGLEDQPTQRWRVRDQGWVVSAGRGLPAIETLKRLAEREQVELRSDQGALDGLLFNLEGLKQSLMPLRKVCRW